MPPTVTINTTAIDVNPGVPGVQVIEGTTIAVQALVADDVQVRNVELLVNGQVVLNDVSFPFDLAAIAPNIQPGMNTMVVQARATDTGGNVTASAADHDRTRARHLRTHAGGHQRGERRQARPGVS